MSDIFELNLIHSNEFRSSSNFLFPTTSLKIEREWTKVKTKRERGKLKGENEWIKELFLKTALSLGARVQYYYMFYATSKTKRSCKMPSRLKIRAIIFVFCIIFNALIYDMYMRFVGIEPKLRWKCFFIPIAWKERARERVSIEAETHAVQRQI